MPTSNARVFCIHFTIGTIPMDTNITTTITCIATWKGIQLSQGSSTTVRKTRKLRLRLLSKRHTKISWLNSPLPIDVQWKYSAGFGWRSVAINFCLVEPKQCLAICWNYVLVGSHVLTACLLMRFECYSSLTLFWRFTLLAIVALRERQSTPLQPYRVHSFNKRHSLSFGVALSGLLLNVVSWRRVRRQITRPKLHGKKKGVGDPAFLNITREVVHTYSAESMRATKEAMSAAKVKAMLNHKCLVEQLNGCRCFVSRQSSASKPIIRTLPQSLAIFK